MEVTICPAAGQDFGEKKAIFPAVRKITKNLAAVYKTVPVTKLCILRYIPWKTTSSNQVVYALNDAHVLI